MDLRDSVRAAVVIEAGPEGPASTDVLTAELGQAARG